MRSIYLVVSVVLIAAFAQPALAGKGKQVRYVGIHPVPKAAGGGVCYIEGPHVHIFAANKLEYRDHRDHNYFVGDPVAYGYDGPKHVYKGHHPIQVHAVVGDDHEDVEFCYLDGAHYHSFAPPRGPEFQVVGDAHFYVAEPPPVYVEARPAMIRVNAVYEPLVYSRPVVTVEAPVGWIGVRAGFGAPAVVVPAAVVVDTHPGRGHAHGRAGIEVVVPTPSISVDIGFGVRGGVIHRDRGYRHHKHKKHKRKSWRR